MCIRDSHYRPPDYARRRSSHLPARPSALSNMPLPVWSRYRQKSLEHHLTSYLPLRLLPTYLRKTLGPCPLKLLVSVDSGSALPQQLGPIEMPIPVSISCSPLHEHHPFQIILPCRCPLEITFSYPYYTDPLFEFKKSEKIGILSVIRYRFLPR